MSKEAITRMDSESFITVDTKMAMAKDHSQEIVTIKNNSHKEEENRNSISYLPTKPIKNLKLHSKVMIPRRKAFQYTVTKKGENP